MLRQVKKLRTRLARVALDAALSDSFLDGLSEESVAAALERMVATGLREAARREGTEANT